MHKIMVQHAVGIGIAGLLPLVLIVCGCSKDSTQPAQQGYPSDAYIATFETVKTRVASLRGLQFVRPVYMKSITRQEFAASNQSTVSGLSASTQRHLVTELAQLGFIPDTMHDFFQQYADFTSGFAGAYYAPGTDSLYIIDTSPDDPYLEFYLSHELTHALQEQHFNAFCDCIWPSSPYSHFNSDFSLAQSCVSEGDAMVVTLLYVERFLLGSGDPAGAADSLAKLDRESFLRDLRQEKEPKMVAIRMDAPYSVGEYFVDTKYQHGGLDGVNGLYKSGRVSNTRTIIAVDGGEQYAFDFGPLYPLLTDSLNVLNYADDDNMGAVLLLALFNRYVDFQNASNGLGLTAERLLYILKNNGGYGAFVWAFGLNSTQASGYLYGLLDSLISNRTLGGQKQSKSYDSTGTVLTLGGGPYESCLVRDSSFVYWVDNCTALERAPILDILKSRAILSKKAAAATAAPSGAFMAAAAKRKVNDYLLWRAFR
jgi:hypothetical protein